MTRDAGPAPEARPDAAPDALPRRVVVTGGSGFIGTNLVDHLLRGGVDVHNLDQAPPRHPDHGPQWTSCDLRDAAAVRAAVEQAAPDAIVHLAARTDLRGATVDDYAVNTDGVRHVVDAARAVGSVRRVLFASSQLVCTPGHRPTDEFDVSPPNPYGVSKVTGERIVRESMGDGSGGDAPTWMLLRPTSIWGPWWGDLYSAFFRTVRAGRYVHPRGARVSKAFGFVGNSVHQVAALLAAPAAAIDGRTLYLSDYEPYPVLEWANEISAAFGRRPVREVPVVVLRAAAKAGDVLRRAGVAEPPLTSYRLSNILTPSSFDMEPLRELCGPLPWTRAEGVAATVEWMRRHPGGRVGTEWAEAA